MYYNYLLDNTKIYWILGIVITLCIIVWLLPNKNISTTTNITVPAVGIVGYEPRYFNDEIYSLPNAKMSPYMIFGGNNADIDYSNQNVQLGYQKLNPIVDLVPKTKPMIVSMNI
jgi:hypothetical protein